MQNSQPNSLSQNGADDQIVVIGHKFIIQGDLVGTGAAIISGKIEGNVTSTQVVVEENASVLGGINCTQLDVSGYVRGLIEAADVTIRKNARIEGNVNYSTLVIEGGSTISGKLKKTNQTGTPPSNLQRQKERFQAFTNIAFPIDLTQKLRSHEFLSGAYLTLIDGSPKPAWINLTEDKMGLVVESFQLQQLREKTLEVKLRLHVGSHYFDVIIPSKE